MCPLLNFASYLVSPICLWASSIDHGCHFRCMNGVWSIWLKQTGTSGLSECFIKHPQRKGFEGRCYFCGEVVTYFGTMTHAVAAVLVTIIAITMHDDGDATGGIIY